MSWWTHSSRLPRITGGVSTSGLRRSSVDLGRQLRRHHHGPPKTDAEAQGATVAITPAAIAALSAIRPAGIGGDEKVFGLSDSQIARRVKAIAKAAGLENWEFFSGHSGRGGMARRMEQNGAPPTRSSARTAGSRPAAILTANRRLGL